MPLSDIIERRRLDAIEAAHILGELTTDQAQEKRNANTKHRSWLPSWAPSWLRQWHDERREIAFVVEEMVRLLKAVEDQRGENVERVGIVSDLLLLAEYERARDHYERRARDHQHNEGTTGALFHGLMDTHDDLGEVELAWRAASAAYSYDVHQLFTLVKGPPDDDNDDDFAIIAKTRLPLMTMVETQLNDHLFDGISNQNYFVGRQGFKLVVSIRGTWDLGDAITNLAGAARPFVVDGVFAHGGIADAADALIEEIADIVIHQIRVHRVKRVVFTGHSLGGGVALLAAAQFTAAFARSSASTTVKRILRASTHVAFGAIAWSSPPVMTDARNLGLEQHLTTFYVGDDVVPHLSFYSVRTFLELLDRIDVVFPRRRRQRMLWALWFRRLAWWSSSKVLSEQDFTALRDTIESFRIQGDDIPPLHIPGLVYRFVHSGEEGAWVVQPVPRDDHPPRIRVRPDLLADHMVDRIHQVIQSYI